MRSQETFRAGHHHGHHRFAALDMGAVKDLDPFGHRLQAKGVHHRVECHAAHRRLRHPPRQSFRRIRGGLPDQGPFLAALRHQDPDPPLETVAERFFHQFRPLDRMRQQDLPRRQAVGVELAKKGIEDPGGAVILRKPRKIRAIPQCWQAR